MTKKTPRIDIIGQNGNDGLHYDDLDSNMPLDNKTEKYAAHMSGEGAMYDHREKHKQAEVQVIQCGVCEGVWIMLEWVETAYVTCPHCEAKRGVEDQ